MAASMPIEPPTDLIVRPDDTAMRHFTRTLDEMRMDSRETAQKLDTINEHLKIMGARRSERKCNACGEEYTIKDDVCDVMAPHRQSCSDCVRECLTVATSRSKSLAKTKRFRCPVCDTRDLTCDATHECGDITKRLLITFDPSKIGLVVECKDLPKKKQPKRDTASDDAHEETAPGAQRPDNDGRTLKRKGPQSASTHRAAKVTKTETAEGGAASQDRTERQEGSPPPQAATSTRVTRTRTKASQDL